MGEAIDEGPHPLFKCQPQWRKIKIKKSVDDLLAIFASQKLRKI